MIRREEKFVNFQKTISDIQYSRFLHVYFG